MRGGMQFNNFKKFAIAMERARGGTLKFLNDNIGADSVINWPNISPWTFCIAKEADKEIKVDIVPSALEANGVYHRYGKILVSMDDLGIEEFEDDKDLKLKDAHLDTGYPPLA